MIRLLIARKWLNRLGYKYRHIGKNVFINGHERPDMIEDWRHFLEVIEELELYLVEFDKTGQMIPKIYPSDCKVGANKRQPIIIITHDQCTFSSNKGSRFRWQKDGDTFLRPKSKSWGIMVFKFLLLFGQLNLLSLSKLSQ